MLPHQPHDLLVIDEAACGAQLGRHAAIAVGRPFGADLLEAFDEPRLRDRLASRFVVVGGSREAHQPASLGDREATGPATTDVVAVVGGRSCRDAPVRNLYTNA